MSNPFSSIFQTDEQEQRDARIAGVRCARVSHLDSDGYILEWLSGDITEPSAPARVATLTAGSERGSFFMPEPDDEVLVAFENGDVDRPIIIGAMWSAEAPPPTQADTSESNNVRTIVSRSGHEITFDDSPGQGKILIKTSGGMEITLQDTPPKVSIKTAAALPATRIEFEGISWNHQHPTGTGPSGPPVSISGT